MGQLAIKWTRIDRFEAHPNNAKGHDLDGLVESFRAYGFRGVVTVTDDSGLTSEGHGRVLGLLRMHGAGEDPPLGIMGTAKGDKRPRKGGPWFAPALFGLPPFDSAEHERAFLIASNRIGEGLWDNRKLAGELQALAKSTKPAITGYTAPDLSALLRSLKTAKGTKPPSNDAPAPPKKPTTKPGDLWTLGDHRLLCGSSVAKADVKRLLEGPADLILTDPPYCSGGFQEAGRASGSIGTRDNRKIANDTLSTRGYKALIGGMLQAWDATSLCMFTDWRQWVNLFDLVEQNGFGVRNMIVWDKGHAGMGQGWRQQQELIMFATRAKVKFDPAKSRGNVVQAKRTNNEHHPTQKPVELLQAILGVHPAPRHVADPFVGSGSVLLACEATGLPFRGMEVEPGFCDVTIERWEQHTGKKAKRKARA